MKKKKNLLILLVHSALRHTLAVKLKHRLYLRLFLSSVDSIQAFALPSPAPATHPDLSPRSPVASELLRQWSLSVHVSLDLSSCGHSPRSLLLASLSSPGFLGIPWLGCPPISLLPAASSLAISFPHPHALKLSPWISSLSTLSS